MKAVKTELSSGRPRRALFAYLLSLALISSWMFGVQPGLADGTVKLQTSQRYSTVTNSNEKCDAYLGSTFSNVINADGSSNLDVWHFVLPSSELSFVNVVPIFSSVYSNPVQFDVQIRDSFRKHAYVYTRASDKAVLVDASATISGGSADRFMLSHTCAGTVPGTFQCPTTVSQPAGTAQAVSTSTFNQVVINNFTVPTGFTPQFTLITLNGSQLVTPSVSGTTYTFSITSTSNQVTISAIFVSTADSNCQSTAKTFTFTPDPGPTGSPSPSCSSILTIVSAEANASGIIEKKLNQDFFFYISATSGGVPASAVTFEVTVPTNAPSGMNVRYVSSGQEVVVSGKSSVTGEYPIRVIATKGLCGDDKTFKIKFVEDLPVCTRAPNVGFVPSSIPQMTVSSTITPVSIQLNDPSGNPNYGAASISPAGSGMLLALSNGTYTLSGTPSSPGTYYFDVSAIYTNTACSTISKTYVFEVRAPQPQNCDATSVPQLQSKSWSFREGDAISDTVEAIRQGDLSSVEIMDSGLKVPPGVLIQAIGKKVFVDGIFSQAGSYFFKVKAKVSSSSKCNDEVFNYLITVVPPTSTPPPAPTQTQTTSPSATPTPSASQTPEEEPSPTPKPTPTVTVTITASPTTITKPESISTPVPTPTQTTTIVEKVPTTAKSKSVVAINCGEVVTLDLKSLTLDGSTFEITSLPTTGKILRPNPDTLIYIPDKEKCELGGNDTFSYALKDKSGNVKTVDKVVTPVLEGDVPKWIRTGYVPENSSRGAWSLVLLGLAIGLIVAIRTRKKSL